MFFGDSAAPQVLHSGIKMNRGTSDGKISDDEVYDAATVILDLTESEYRKSGPQS